MSSAPLQGTASAALAIDRVKYSHDGMIDLIIASPQISQTQIAAHFGYSASWVSRIFNSDAFQARLAERKGDLIDPTILISMDERLKTLAAASADILLKKLLVTESPDMAVKALEVSTKALGYGARPQNQITQNNFVVAMPTKIPNAADWAAKARAHGLEAPSDVSDAVMISPTLQALAERA